MDANADIAVELRREDPEGLGVIPLTQVAYVAPCFVIEDKAVILLARNGEEAPLEPQIVRWNEWGLTSCNFQVRELPAVQPANWDFQDVAREVWEQPPLIAGHLTRSVRYRAAGRDYLELTCVRHSDDTGRTVAILPVKVYDQMNHRRTLPFRLVVGAEVYNGMRPLLRSLFPESRGAMGGLALDQVLATQPTSRGTSALVDAMRAHWLGWRPGSSGVGQR